MLKTSSKQKASQFKRFTKKLKRFSRETSANVAMLFALSAVPLVGVAGMGLDGSRMLLARFELQGALDAAVLAVGSTTDDTIDLDLRVEEYTRQNFNVTGATPPDVTLGPLVNGRRSAYASTKINTFFLPVLEIDELDAKAESQINLESSGMMISLVLDNTGSMSNDNKIGSLRTATKDLINVLFGVPDGTAPASVPDNPLVKISIVPYVTSVNVGDEVLNFATADQIASYNGYKTKTDTVGTSTPGFWTDGFWTNGVWTPGYMSGGVWHSGVWTPGFWTPGFWTDEVVGIEAVEWEDKWKGCVMERANDGMYNAAASGDAKTPASYTGDTNSIGQIISRESTETNAWEPYIVPSGVDSNKNEGCATPITPLTSNYKTLIDTTNTSHPTGMKTWDWGTVTDIGVSWGLRTLMPTAPYTQSNDDIDPLNGQTIWNSNNWQRAILIMTDGKSVFNPDSMWNGYGKKGDPIYNSQFGSTTNHNQIPDRIDNRIGYMCAKAKEQGILVFTVTFGSGASSGYIKDIYEKCATSTENYFHAPSSADLKNAFNAIGTQLSRLRISK